MTGSGARQAFERSARQAGYFESGEDRLIRPKIAGSAKSQNAETVASSPDAAEVIGHRAEINNEKGSQARLSNEYHPFVQGLLDELPRSDQFTEWELNDQAEWLQAAASIFKLLSKKKGRVEVKVWEDKETPIG